MSGARSKTEAAVPKHLQEAVDECAARFGANLRSVLWHGSRARGEAQEGSDEDLILLFGTVDDGVLLGLREVFLGAGRTGWSTYVVSEAELRQLPASRRIRFAHGFQVLLGRFEPLELSRGDVLAYLRETAREIEYQCRDRLINKKASLSTLHRMAKYAVFAMKARHLLEHGAYPLTRRELLAGPVQEPDDRTIIEWVEGWQDVREGFGRDATPLILKLDGFARRLLATLPEA